MIFLNFSFKKKQYTITDGSLILEFLTLKSFSLCKMWYVFYPVIQNTMDTFT